MKTGNRNKKVSIVIPTYRPLRTLEKCLRSIEAQTYKNIEIIIVDSTPKINKERSKVQKIVEQYGKYIVDGPERSIQRNRGIFESRGEYILTIDQDMYLTKNVVKDCVTTITKKHFIALIVPEISIGKGYWTECVSLERYISIYLENGMNECCRFFRKKDALKISGYDPTIVGVEDSDFHYRIEKLGKIGKTREIIYHDEGSTSYWGRIKKKYYYSKAFRMYLERHPNIAIKQFFPIKKAYFIHWRRLLEKPHIAFGIVLLRGGEVAAGALGMINNGNET